MGGIIGGINMPTIGNKKFKYDRRRALMWKLVRKSKSNKGYFIYDV